MKEKINSDHSIIAAVEAMKGLWKPKRKTADQAARPTEKKKLKTNISSSSSTSNDLPDDLLFDDILARSSHYLPHDLLFAEVLARLPAKSLCRFKLVCRLWHSAISEAVFAREQSRHESSTSSGIIYCDDHRRLNFLPTQGTSVGVPCTSVGFESSANLQLVTCTHGLIIVGIEAENRWKRSLYVCNPATGERERIPTISDFHSWLPAGLAFDPSTSPDEYKIVLPEKQLDARFEFVPLERYMDVRYQIFCIFSSTSGQWTESSPKKIHCGASIRIWSKSVFAAGAIYWCSRYGILSYKVSEDTARVIKWPWPTSLHYASSSDEIGVCKESLTCTRTTKDGVEIWVMDMEDKWSLRHRIFMEQVMERNPAIFYPLLPTVPPIPGRYNPPELNWRLWNNRSKWKWLRTDPLPYYGGNNIYFRIYENDMGKDGEREVIIGYDMEGGKAVLLCENKLALGDSQRFFYSYHNSLLVLPRQVSSPAMAYGVCALSAPSTDLHL